MIHPVRTLELGPHRKLEVGCTVCFGEPSVRLITATDGKLDAELSVPASQVEALIAALGEALAMARANDPR
jgi:hypothetical protein